MRLHNYRLRFVAEIGSAQAIELQFNILGPLHSEGARHVFRMTAADAFVGIRSSDEAGPERVSMPVELASGSTAHQVTLVRLNRTWIVSLDERVVGQVASVIGPDLPEVRFVVEGGEAAFSEIGVVELEPREQESS